MAEAPGSQSVILIGCSHRLSHKEDQRAAGWRVCMLGLHVGMHAE